MASRSRIRRERAQAQHAVESARADFIHTAEVASFKNKDIPEQAFCDVIGIYQKYNDEYAAEEKKLLGNCKSRKEFGHELCEMNKAYCKKTQEHIEAIGGDTKKAWAAISKEMQPQSMFTPAVKMFYDSDEKGVQWSGFAGAAALGGLAYYLTEGWSWFARTVATVASILGGAYIANQLLATKQDLPNFHDKIHAAPPIPSPPALPATCMNENVKPIPGVVPAPIDTLNAILAPGTTPQIASNGQTSIS